MAPWECINPDFITQLLVTSRGHDAVMVVIVKLTKMVHINLTTTTCTAVTVAGLCRDHVFKLHGIPEGLLVTETWSSIVLSILSSVLRSGHVRLCLHLIILRLMVRQRDLTES